MTTKSVLRSAAATLLFLGTIQVKGENRVDDGGLVQEEIGSLLNRQAKVPIRLDLLERMTSRLLRRADNLGRISKKYWTARRILFVAGGLLALVSCSFSGTVTGLLLAAVFVVAFIVVAFYHRKVEDSLLRNSLLLGIKQVQIARIQLDWDHIPRPAESPELATEPATQISLSESSIKYSPETAHPFETDLDITGERSLHRLMDIAITTEGSERLRSWLLQTKPDLSVIGKRQSLVQELKGHSIFRDKLQLLSAVASKSANSQKTQPSQLNSRILVEWIERGVHQESLLVTVKLLFALAALNIALVVLAFLNLIPHVWPLVFLAYAGVSIAKQPRIATAWDELQELEKALLRFKAVFQYLESRNYRNTPGLAQVCAPFRDRRRRPSAEVWRLERLASALGLRTNALLWLLVHAFIPWDFYFTYRLELIRKEIAHLLPQWLDAWYELEALNSLANFAYLNTDYVFPQVTLDSNVFAGEALCHPLLKRERKICNDFVLTDDQRIVILTGSNMAGKSTFLRTVGVNLCLAYAGAPVNANRLQASLFRIFTCIKVSDSVQDGLSYFYAEVKRLKALLSATEVKDELPVLFLIDEIFRGTNSRERLIGSRVYIRELSQRDTLGLVATHDLELVKLSDEIHGVANFHFREEVREGKMVFDYHLRPGPCPTTNALQIMKLEGLPVGE